MKVVIYKSYSKSFTVSCHDDYDDVWHNFNTVENVKEVTEAEFEVLKRAIDYFNSKGNKDYALGYIVVIEDEEINLLLNDYKAYEKQEREKADKCLREKMEKEIVVKARSEARKHERTVKKIAKELNLSEEQVKAMLANKK